MKPCFVKVYEKDLADIVPGSELYKRIQDLIEGQGPRWDAFVAVAQKRQRDGELEIDDEATVSDGCDPGAYVQAWIWVEDEAVDEFLAEQKEKADAD